MIDQHNIVSVSGGKEIKRLRTIIDRVAGLVLKED